MQQEHKNVVSDRDRIIALAQQLEKTFNETVEHRDKLQTDLDNLWKDHHGLQKRFNDNEGQLEEIQSQFQEMELQKKNVESLVQGFVDTRGMFLFSLT